MRRRSWRQQGEGAGGGHAPGEAAGLAARQGAQTLQPAVSHPPTSHRYSPSPRPFSQCVGVAQYLHEKASGCRCTPISLQRSLRGADGKCPRDAKQCQKRRSRCMQKRLEKVGTKPLGNTLRGALRQLPSPCTSEVLLSSTLSVPSKVMPQKPPGMMQPGTKTSDDLQSRMPGAGPRRRELDLPPGGRWRARASTRQRRPLLPREATATMPRRTTGGPASRAHPQNPRCR